MFQLIWEGCAAIMLGCAFVAVVRAIRNQGGEKKEERERGPD
jgi:hypothetical protein